MITRIDYVSGVSSHQEYFEQFVTPDIKKQVVRAIGIERLLSFECEHLNDIPCANNHSVPQKHYRKGMVNCWDNVPISVAEVLPLLKEAGETQANPTPSTLVCIKKAAARMVIKENQ